MRRRHRNRWHPEDAYAGTPKTRGLLKRASPQYRKRLKRRTSSREGKEALRRFRAFTGVPYPPEILNIPAPGNKTMVGMGKAPEIVYHDGRKVVRRKGSWFGVFNAKGRRIVLLNRRKGIPKHPRKRYLGRMVETHYILPKGVEIAGSFKRGKYWIHEHKDEGGRWPKGFVDQNGNIWYAPGTYRIGRWIRR